MDLAPESADAAFDVLVLDDDDRGSRLGGHIFVIGQAPRRHDLGWFARRSCARDGRGARIADDRRQFGVGRDHGLAREAFSEAFSRDQLERIADRRRIDRAHQVQQFVVGAHS